MRSRRSENFLKKNLEKIMLRKSLIIIALLLFTGCTNIEIKRMGAGAHVNGAQICWEELLTPATDCSTLWYSPTQRDTRFSNEYIYTD